MNGWIMHTNVYGPSVVRFANFSVWGSAGVRALKARAFEVFRARDDTISSRRPEGRTDVELDLVDVRARLR